MELYYVCSRLPQVKVAVGDLVSVGGQTLRVKALPANAAVPIIMELPAGGIQDFDYNTVAIGMYWS